MRRPGKETGVFEVVVAEGAADNGASSKDLQGKDVEETEDEADSRRLMEEVQRTFIHLEEGSRGRCFDPRALVEACACLKLEFDVWQQNDASEFATKLLDRLEISLKKWAPEHFHYLHHTFGLKQTKQKICKECGLKTNREEPHMNIDCQIRGKSDVHEALSSLCETEIMEGNNQVFCDNCKKNTDTVLRTTISELPNMMILSLKRFDLDYTTFETVKLNSRCEFGQSLNMKRYTLEGVEAMEQAERENEDTDDMEIGSEENAMKHLRDEDYEYKLAGVLVHAGVAQGGHYYSFIKDRSDDKWYRFDDEDITPFDPSSIENECFGGKIKKDTKWPNGQIHSVESEQYANALMLFYEKVKPKELPPREQSEETKPLDLTNIKMTDGYDVFEPDVRRSNATHRWQSFLFDAEFQHFLAGLLSLCRISISNPEQINAMDTVGRPVPTPLVASPWRRYLFRTLLSFVFDVLLYSNERPGLADWVRQIENIMENDQQCAQDFALTLALRSSETSSNWLRTFLLECPDQTARYVGVRVFSQAIRCALASPDEQKKLERWVEAWKEQFQKMNAAGTVASPTLEKEWAALEDVKSNNTSASAVGSILSFTNSLVDAVPRTWRSSPELFQFIRNLAGTNSASGDILRDAMIHCLLPPRMICVVTRGGTTAPLTTLFPAASLQREIAETQMRPEQHQHSHHMMSAMAGNHAMNSAHSNYRDGPPPQDFVSLFEALGCLLGIREVVLATLITEQEEQVRGRSRAVLTDPAMQALREIFQENCSENAPGMDQREIESYLHRSNIDNVPTQRIVDLMTKYPTSSRGATGYLSLDAFLHYYRDSAQSNEAKVRQDFRTFGFRPDLSRRPKACRIAPSDGKRPIVASESVALDVAAKFPDAMPTLGPLGDRGVSSLRFYEVVFTSNDHIGEYLLASAFLRKNLDASFYLIISALRNIYQSTTSWNGEIFSGVMPMLKMLASIPDEFQKQRVDRIMLAADGETPDQARQYGLIAGAKQLNGNRTQSYSQDMAYAYERYLSCIRELADVRFVYDWLKEHQHLWAFMERDLFNRHRPSRNAQSRGDYSVAREPDDGGIGLDHHHHSDSDGGMHGSDEEEMDLYNEGPSAMCVIGAGNTSVDGSYVRDGYFEKAFKYSKHGEHLGRKAIFSIFKCNVSNNTKHWYISVIPDGSAPGTSSDVDFYSAPVSADSDELPPLRGWVKAVEGRDPAPTITYTHGNVSVNDSNVDDSPTGIGYGDEWPDDPGGNGRSYV
ncbi:MAG: hypothetical protein SGILL_001411 [Bacillariaceae sp.]